MRHHLLPNATQHNILHRRPLFHPRAHLVSYCNHRSIHCTPARPFLEPALVATHDLFETLHTASGLPWVASLSLGALTLRTVFTTPLSLYSRRVLQQQAALKPLLQAWKHKITHQVMAESRSLGPYECEKRIKSAVRKKGTELYKRWKCPSWKLWLPVGQIPVFLVAIETIRRMCGTHEGLLGLAVKQFRPSSEVAPETTRAEAVDSLRATDGTAVSMEDSFSWEGGLWFHDLLAPDPLLILPFILSGTLLASISVGTWSRLDKERQSVFQRRLSNSLKVIALLMVPATLQVPSAMLVYWISSSFFALCQAVLLDRLMPLQRPPPSSKELLKVGS